MCDFQCCSLESSCQMEQAVQSNQWQQTVGEGLGANLQMYSAKSTTVEDGEHQACGVLLPPRHLGGLRAGPRRAGQCWEYILQGCLPPTARSCPTPSRWDPANHSALPSPFLIPRWVPAEAGAGRAAGCQLPPPHSHGRAAAVPTCWQLTAQQPRCRHT